MSSVALPEKKWLNVWKRENEEDIFLLIERR